MLVLSETSAFSLLGVPAPFRQSARSLRCKPILARASNSMALRMISADAIKETQSAEEIHNRQWELNKQNFRAQWECDMNWYMRSSDATTSNQDLWTQFPVEVKKDVSYTISFSDSDTGIWDGKNLRFAPGGAMKLNLSRLGYNGGPGIHVHDSVFLSMSRGSSPFGRIQCIVAENRV